MPHPYDTKHKKERAKALAEMHEGERCILCGKGMFKSQPLDFHHLQSLKLGGAPDGPKKLVHRRCNRAQGPALAQVGRRLPVPRNVEPPIAYDGPEDDELALPRTKPPKYKDLLADDPTHFNHTCVNGRRMQIPWVDCDDCAAAENPDPPDPRQCGHYEIWHWECDDCKKFHRVILDAHNGQ